MMDDSSLALAIGDWRCRQCGEISPSTFATCWHCGASAAGQADPTFQRVSDAEVSNLPADEPDWTLPQRSLSELLAWMTLLAVSLGILVYLPPLLVLFIALSGIVAAPLCQMPVRQLRRFLRR